MNTQPRTPLATLACKRPNLVLAPDEIIGASSFMDPASHTGAAAILEENKLTGILTERDLLKRVLARDLDPLETKVYDVMTHNPISISINAGLQAALDVMTGSGYRYLPVVNDEDYIGMIDIRDLYEEMRRILMDSMQKQSTLFSNMLREPYGYGGGEKIIRPFGAV